MTDHELAVKMVKQGIEVFKEINKDTLFDPGSPLQVSLIPILLATCINAAGHVHIMKQLAAAISNKEVKLP